VCDRWQALPLCTRNRLAASQEQMSAAQVAGALYYGHELRN
jgi:hypothetical protein